MKNASLSYTGIDKHEGESVGGWDTVLRREEYEALYSKQQATITSLEEAIIPEKFRNRSIIDINAEKEEAVMTAAESVSENDETEEIPDYFVQFGVGVKVMHSKFGLGTIVWADKNNYYFRVKFAVGEKQFLFPMAFEKNYLKIAEE